MKQTNKQTYPRAPRDWCPCQASSPIISAVMFRQQRSHSGMHEAVIIADGTVDIALTARP